MTRVKKRRCRNYKEETASILTDGIHLASCPHEDDAPSDSAEIVTVENWRAVDGVYTTTCDLFFSTSPDLVCAIMQEATHTAQVDDIPSTWLLERTDVANTVRLICSHSFHVAALALHFLTRDMRCPVCRSGYGVPMDIKCVPADVRDLYIAKINALRVRNIEDEVSNIPPEHIVDVLWNTELECHIRNQDLSNSHNVNPSVVAHTRIIFDDSHVQNIRRSIVMSETADMNLSVPMTTNFSLHRSFQRLVRNLVARQYSHNPGGIIQFALTHPLLPLQIISNNMSVAEAWHQIFNPVYNSAACDIPLFCAAVGGLQPVAYLRSVYCHVTKTAQITIDVNMHLIMNISGYVREVLDSIRETISNSVPHNAIPYPNSLFASDPFTNMPQTTIPGNLSAMVVHEVLPAPLFPVILTTTDPLPDVFASIVMVPPDADAPVREIQ